MATQRRGQVHGRSQIANFICPDNGHRGVMARKGKLIIIYSYNNYYVLLF
jgi:hypothetical protein